MKRFWTFVISFVPWLLSGFIFSSNFGYYKDINKPFFALPSQFFSIVWFTLYFLIAISITILVCNNYIKYEKDYKSSLIFNYIFNQLYTFFFFVLKNNFLGLIDSIIVLITSIVLFIEIKKIDKNKSYFLIPYILWNIFAFILSISIIILN